MTTLHTISEAMRGDPVPPHSLGSEQALLGAILHHFEELDTARDHVQAADFFEAVHRHIFEVMCQRRDAGEPIDLGLMKAVLGNADLGGTSVGQYIADLMGSATTISGAPGYARLIASAARMRLVLDTAQEAVTAMIFNPRTGEMVEINVPLPRT